MPSKTKKHSKSTGRSSNADLTSESPSPQTSSSCKSVTDSQFSEEALVLALEEASSRYPSLIGKSALVGRVMDIESEPSRGCKIWLSESSMVASSLAPGSVVSVSIAASDMGFSNSFPLSSILGECSGQFEVESMNGTSDALGNYFALATVFPSHKVLKNGVKLSSSLSYTLGCLASGRVIFVYPIQSQFLPALVNGNNGLHNTKLHSLFLHDCNELHLELMPFKDRVEVNNKAKPKMSFSIEKPHNQFENGLNSSPNMHLNKQFASPISEEAACSLSKPNDLNVGSFDIKDILKDESARQLLQACATSWLYSRIVMCGNIVAIPILSQLCIFHVVRANKLPGNTNRDLRQDRGDSLCHPDSESVDYMKDAFLVNRKTKVYLYLSKGSVTETPQKGIFSHEQIICEQAEAIGRDDISKLGGLDKEYAVLKDIIVSSTKSTLSNLGLQTTKGVLLHGPPGTGKTSLARLCAHDAGVKLFSVNGPEIVSQYYGKSEQAILEVFDSASQAAPAVVFIDELDAIAPARKDGGEELSHRMVATLLTLMDGISRIDGLLVIAATNRRNSIEPALRRPGRLDREIEIGVPSPKQRLNILNALLSDMKHSLSDMQVQHLAMVTHGFVGADLAALCNEAALIGLRRYVAVEKSSNNLHCIESSSPFDYSDSVTKEFECSNKMRDILKDSADSTSLFVSDIRVSLEVRPSSHGNGISEIAEEVENGIGTNTEEAFFVEQQNMLEVVFEDFEKAKIKVRPSAMREVILEVPKVNWEDVGGQREVKAQLMEAVEWPQKHQDAFKRIGTRPPAGILLFGPPGCSKTLMARAVASETGLNFLAVKGPELFSKWVGESEKAVRSLFAKARANAPSIIFFDEIDGLAVIRGKESDGVSVSDRVMSQLLVELDGLHQRVDVTVIAATNRPDKIDPALLRPGRLDRLLYVGPPNETDREEIFRIHLRKIPCSSDVNIKELASLTDGCTGADISLICRDAAVAAIEESIDASEVTMQHFKTAIREVQPLEIHSYQELSAKFQRLVHSNHSGYGLEHQKCSSRSSWFPIWGLIKSIVKFLSRFQSPGSKSPCR